MPWIIGIDEAGYGPNLGPLVMTAVACRVPTSRKNADLWSVLRAAVRRIEEPEDGRLLIADSKLVYSPARGLMSLETGALALSSHILADRLSCLSECLQSLCPDSRAVLTNEPWYVGDSRLPLIANVEVVAQAARQLRAACVRQRLLWGQVQSVIVCPRAFNAMLDTWGSKGAVLSHALAALIQRLRDRIADGDPLVFIIDKHGGRNHYAATLQNAIPGAMLVAREESAACSTYAALGLERKMRFAFQPRADAEHFCVAAASMVSKYLREALMAEFNHFWRMHVPNLRPTAGYPSDAVRFLKDVRPAMQQLRIEEVAIWRRK